MRSGDQHGFYAEAALNLSILRRQAPIASVKFFSDGDSGTPSLFVQAAILC
ncbi:fructose/tagatose bisphosphate aldolase [Rhodopirellula rubra]|uniref:Fructose/tagatose bisphosphate aldolase n=1 Tax=Aporhodopirellula rubra TaxID=980271 RepID=A0A7W5H8C3_9BACT|nr:fructose/tagatose bisphosphate aldolase [Aporhodopirellula rubra]